MLVITFSVYPVRSFQLTLMFVSKDEAYSSYVRLGWKGPTSTNTLAYVNIRKLPP